MSNDSLTSPLAESQSEGNICNAEERHWYETAVWKLLHIPSFTIHSQGQLNALRTCNNGPPTCKDLC